MYTRHSGVRNAHVARRTLLSAAAATGLAGLSACGTESASSVRTSSPAPQSPSPYASEEPATEAPETASLEQIEEALGERTPHQWGLAVSGTVTSFAARGNQAVLTLDACGGPGGSGYDAALIDTLRSTSTAATLFINRRWAQENPSITQELVEDPLFEIANHGTRHLPLSVIGQAAYGIPGTADLAEAHAEVVENQEYFQDSYGVQLRHFRSGTAHVDDVAVEMAAMLGVEVVNFSLNADAGATFSAPEVEAALAPVQPGDICIGHFNQPQSGSAAGIASALESAAENGIEWINLEQALSQS